MLHSRPEGAASRSRLGLILLILAIAACFSACKGPCEELADRICECELSASSQNQCNEQVRDAMQLRDVSAAEEAVCEAKLEGCTCEALEADDLAACGLAKD